MVMTKRVGKDQYQYLIIYLTLTEPARKKLKTAMII